MAAKPGRWKGKAFSGQIFIAACIAAAVFLALSAYTIAAAWFAPKPQAFFPIKEAAMPVSAPVKSEGLDLNTATREELTALPGIGEKTADAILLFRQEHGRFHYLEDLMAVKGIGAKKTEALKGLLYIGDAE